VVIKTAGVSDVGDGAVGFGEQACGNGQARLDNKLIGRDAEDPFD
jgi:hypothetical protein